MSQGNFSSFTAAKMLYTQGLYTTGKFKVMLSVLFSTMDSRDGGCYQTSIAFSTISQSLVWEDYTFSLTAAFLFPNVVIFFYAAICSEEAAIYSEDNTYITFGLQWNAGT